jgi:chorismate mutase
METIAETPVETIESLREEIKGVDRQIVILLSERIKRVLRIGTLKKEQSRCVQDLGQEKEKMRWLFELSQELNVPPIFIAIVFRDIMQASKRLQSPHVEDIGPLPILFCVNCGRRSVGLEDPVLKWRVCPACPGEPLIPMT